MHARYSGARPRALASLISILVLLGGGVSFASAQEREVVSKQIAVGGNDASLRIDFATGTPLEVAFEGGSVRLNGSPAGPYSPELDAAWRLLLAQVITLDGAPLVAALIDWSPPEGLVGEARTLAARVDETLQRALGDAPPESATVGSEGGNSEAMTSLLGRPRRLTELASALDGVRLQDVHLHVGQRVEIGAGDRPSGTWIVVDGDLTVRGVADGDVIVVGGTVRVPEGGRILGDVRMVDARLYRDGGDVLGSVTELDAPAPGIGELRDRIREEVLREVRNEIGSAPRGRNSTSIFAPLRNVGRGIAGVVSNLLTVVVLTVLGGVVLHFGGSNLEVVADTARRYPSRSAAVGLAGAFLALPAWLLGAVALAISIIGIPVILAWIPLFPIAVALAVLLGYYAVARNVGAWIARQRYPYFGWVRPSNTLTLVSAGVLALTGAFIASNALEIGGQWFSLLRGLFMVGGILLTISAALVGFGAVLITRGGRRPEFYPGGDFMETGWGDEYSAAPGGNREQAPEDP